MIDLKHLVEHGPRRADRVLAKLANGQLTLRVEVAALDRALQGLDRAAGCIALGWSPGR